MNAEQIEAKRAYNRAYRAAHLAEDLDRSRAWAAAHHEARIEYNHAYYAAHRTESILKRRAHAAVHPYRGMTDEKRERHRLTQADQRRRHPERSSARLALAYAVRSGRLVRGPCVTCDEPRTHGHHHAGYGRENWLVVTWLCKTHHGEAHRAALDVA